MGDPVSRISQVAMDGANLTNTVTARAYPVVIDVDLFPVENISAIAGGPAPEKSATVARILAAGYSIVGWDYAKWDGVLWQFSTCQADPN